MLNKVMWPALVGGVLAAVFAFLGQEVPAGLEAALITLVMLVTGFVKKESASKVKALKTL